MPKAVNGGQMECRELKVIELLKPILFTVIRRLSKTVEIFS